MRATSGSRTCSIIAKNLLAPRAGVEIGVDAQHLVDLAADRDHRIEGRHRLLEDHRHSGGAQLPQAAVAGGKQFLADQLELPPAGTSAPFCNSPITVSDVTDLPEPLSPTTTALALAHLQGKVVDDPGRASVPAEADDEILDVEDEGGHRSWSRFTCRSPAASCGGRARRARRPRSG